MYFFIIFYLLLFFYSFINRKIIPIALPIFLFAYPVNMPYINWGAFGIDDLFIIASFVTSLKARGGIFDRWVNLNTLLFLIYSFGAFIGVLTVDNYSIIDFFKSTLQYFYLLIIVINIKKNSDLWTNFYIGLLFAVFIQSLFAIILYVQPLAFSYIADISAYIIDNSVFRASGTFKGPWDLGGVLVITVLFLYYFLDTIKGKCVIVLQVITLILAVYAIVLTNSRSSWLFFITSMPIIFFKQKVKYLYLFVSICFFVSFFFDYSLIFQHIDSRINYTFDGNSLDSSSQARLDIWYDILSKISFPYLLIGCGSVYFFSMFNHTPHNSYLAILCYSGLLGLIVFLRYFYFVFTIFIKTRYRVFIISLILGFSLFSLTVDSLYTPAIIHVLSFVLSLLYYRHYKEIV